MEWQKEPLTEALSTAGRAVVDEGFTIAPEFEEDNIHQFRVATKRLRALLRLVEGQPGVPEKLPKKFRKLYQLSGNIRDAQLMIKRAGKAVPEVAEYVSWLERQKAKAQQDFRDFYDSAIIVKMEKKLRKIEPQPLAVATLREFFAGHMADIEAILHKKGLEEEDLHDIRKKIKDLLYVAKVAAEFWPEGLEEAGVSGMLQSLDDLAERAGNFNDQHNALVSIESFIEAEKPSEATLALQQEWQEKKAKSMEKLVAEIARFQEESKDLKATVSDQ